MPVNDLTKEGEKKQNKQRVLLISMLMGLHSSAVGFSCGHTAARDLGQASERKKKRKKRKNQYGASFTFGIGQEMTVPV